MYFVCLKCGRFYESLRELECFTCTCGQFLRPTTKEDFEELKGEKEAFYDN